MSETLMPARPRSGKRRSFIVWIQLKKMRLNFTGSTRRGTRMLPYLPGVHSPQWVYRPLDRLHQGHSALFEPLDQKLLPKSDTMLTGIRENRSMGQCTPRSRVS